MAAQVKLVRRRDFSSDISSLSLFNYEDGFSLTRDGWIQAVARDGDASVAEVMTLRVEASSHDDLASTLQLMDDKLEEVGWHASSAERYGVWLRAQLPDETKARQALIKEAGGEIGSPVLAPPLSPGNALREYHLALERMPWWESTAFVYYPTAGYTSGVNCLGGTFDYTGLCAAGDVPGNKPARLADTAFKGASGGGGPLYEFWMGFRTDRFGDRANFAPVWDIGQSSDSVPYNDTASTSDSAARGGYKWRCSFGAGEDPALLRRVAMVLQSFTSDYADQRGSYVVLLRAKVGSGTTCHVRLHDGFAHTWAGLRAQPRVEIASTSWMLYPLGTVDIPPSRGIIGSPHMRQYGFELYAERTAGSSYLDMDCMVLIPRGEGFIHVSGGGVQYALGDQKQIQVRIFPTGESTGWWYTSNMPWASVTVESEDYALPAGSGSLVLAGQRETVHALSDYAGIGLSCYPRWRSFRGAG